MGSRNSLAIANFWWIKTKIYANVGVPGVRPLRMIAGRDLEPTFQVRGAPRSYQCNIQFQDLENLPLYKISTLDIRFHQVST